jgi:hypothetical protein
MTSQELAMTIIAALDLDPAPIAIAFADQPPAGVDVIQNEVPSSARSGAEPSRGCSTPRPKRTSDAPVGAMVMGFELPQPVADELGQLVSSMCDCGYIASDEPAHIPAVPFKPKGIVYGRLDAFPLRAD